MQRVLIIGSPGAGKSTVSGALATRAGLPLHHLDRMHWLPGWIERDREEGRAELAGVLAQDSWIIDGNYGSSLPLRLERADTVVWLDYPTRVCVARVVKRWWRYRGCSRPDMTEGCPERFNLEFLFTSCTFAAHGADATVRRSDIFREPSCASGLPVIWPAGWPPFRAPKTLATDI